MSDQIKATAIPCHITDSEREALNSLAVDLGYKSVSAFVRDCIFVPHEEHIRALQDQAANRRSGFKSRTFNQA